jgi:hypothetical protein
MIRQLHGHRSEGVPQFNVELHHYYYLSSIFDTGQDSQICGQKKSAHSLDWKLNSKSPMNASPASYPKITIPHKNDCTRVLKTGLCVYSRTYKSKNFCTVFKTEACT